MVWCARRAESICATFKPGKNPYTFSSLESRLSWSPSSEEMPFANCMKCAASLLPTAFRLEWSNSALVLDLISDVITSDKTRCCCLCERAAVAVADGCCFFSSWLLSELNWFRETKEVVDVVVVDGMVDPVEVAAEVDLALLFLLRLREAPVAWEPDSDT